MPTEIEVQKAEGRFHDRPRWTTDGPGLLHNAGVAEPGRGNFMLLVVHAEDFGLGLRRVEIGGDMLEAGKVLRGNLLGSPRYDSLLA